jgi:hypothetical protein
MHMDAPFDRLRGRPVLRKADIAQNLAAILVEIDRSRLLDARGMGVGRECAFRTLWQGNVIWLIS